MWIKTLRYVGVVVLASIVKACAVPESPPLVYSLTYEKVDVVEQNNCDDEETTVKNTCVFDIRYPVIAGLADDTLKANLNTQLKKNSLTKLNIHVKVEPHMKILTLMSKEHLFRMLSLTD